MTNDRPLTNQEIYQLALWLHEGKMEQEVLDHMLAQGKITVYEWVEVKSYHFN